MSFRIVAPVAVKPETLSNHALISENSPPQIRYGNIPTTLARTHEPTTIEKPSLFEIDVARGTKSIGNAPRVKVSSADSSSG
jgi:hypothetical protein